MTKQDLQGKEDILPSEDSIQVVQRALYELINEGHEYASSLLNKLQVNILSRYDDNLSLLCTPEKDPLEDARTFFSLRQNGVYGE